MGNNGVPLSQNISWKLLFEYVCELDDILAVFRKIVKNQATSQHSGKAS